ncbi:glycosyltransferase [Aminobacterium sp. MB27-C1]|uniref:glycosyltransferase n=1 Tax=Aminobacterium sp. MB27-C1 TaxID=3070661 RepID=UPI0027DCD846|nr:glycosyltransferase [Aminobacterium sp. MB27-C1]WMI71637.1 glycosyltransferase [Aminobacterium sp. MB27-C1]
MYVLVIAGGIPSNKYRGNGIFEFDQAKALANAGIKVVYVAVDVRSLRRWRKWGYERYDVAGVHVFCVNIPLGRLPKFILRKISIYGLQSLYKKVFREFGKPDVLHAHFTNMGYIAAQLKKRIDVPLVITEHSSALVQPVLGKRVFEIAKEAYSNAEAVIAVSPSLAKVIQDKFKIKTRFVPNIVDTEIFNFNTADKVENKVFRFISVGNLIYSKRMDLIVKAFYKVFIDNPHVSLTILGEGSERKRIEKYISKYKLGDRVKLLGVQPRTNVAKELKRSNCFVLPSRFETFGVAYIEALAVGVPVIATKCGGPECFVHKRNGLLIPVDDEEALVFAMKYMYEHNEKYNKQKIALETKNRFSPENISKELIKIFKEILVY